MRVTANSFPIDLRQQLSSLMAKQSTLQMRATTGQRVENASDDPRAMHKIMALEEEQRALYQYEKNISNVRENVDVAYSSVSSMKKVFDRAFEIATLAEDIRNHEPLSALDAHLVIRMQSVLTRLQRELDITFVYVTHSQSEAFALADRVVIMADGEIEQVGPPRAIYRTPVNRFVAEFVGRNNILSGRVTECEGGMLTVESDAGPCTAPLPDGLEISVGHRLDLVVSADVIAVSDTKPEADNVIACSLISEEFVGSVVTLFLETEGGVEFKAQIQQREIENLDLRSTSWFFLSWPTTSVHVLPE